MAPASSSKRSSPRRKISCPLPRKEQELELNNLDVGLLGEYLNINPSWEDMVVNKIKNMMVMEQGQVLDTICHFLEKENQLWEKPEVSFWNPSVQKLLEFLNLDPRKATDKAFFFHLYGIILRECPSVEKVQCHLASLLDLSHQHSRQREGIALAVGLASTRHLEEVWALLEHLGRTKFLQSVAATEDSQPSDNLRWKWVSSTSLLCYGQIAKHTKEQILPWVDNIASRMVYYFSCGPCDEILKSSFLSATILLTRSLQAEYSSQRYKFTQIPELIQCLLGILQKEPNSLTNFLRQKIILVIIGLSNLRPRFKPLLKSQILKTCLQSVIMLPPAKDSRNDLFSVEQASDTTVLYKKTVRALDLLLQNFISENPSMDEVCFLLQHIEYWLMSDKIHERSRAVQSIYLLLQYVVDSLKLAKEAVPSMLGHQIGILILLWRDKDKITQQHSHFCVYLLMELVFQQKGKLVESAQWSKMKHFESNVFREWEMKLYHLVKVFKEDLTVAQHTQLILTLVHSLGSYNHLHCDLAAKLLLLICVEPGFRKEQIAELLQGLFQELPNIQSKSVQQAISQATLALGTQHIQEVVEVILSLCQPSERWILPLWKALAANYQVARDVITLLYIKLKLRPPRRLLQSTYRARLVSLMALGTIYELLYTKEYRNTVCWAFSGILLGLLTELYYLLEVGLVQGMFDYQEDDLGSKPIGPCRICMEALKGLFWTTEYWEVFADVKLIQGWELFGQLETFPKGVTLLARAMAHYNCEIKAVLGQALISLKSSEERDNIVGICIITEFLNSPDVSQHMSWKTMYNSLNLGLSSRNQMVRAMSLKGLGSTLMHPKKATLLRIKLMELLNNFLQPEFKDPAGLMKIMGHLLHCLSAQGIGIVSLRIAQHLLSLFTDERAAVREGAIFLFGDVIHYGGKKLRQSLKDVASQATVPLLFNMADPCQEVATKARFTFLRCAILLKWEFRKELFGKLAWGQGLGAANDIFIYMLESNVGNYQQFLSQALKYLDSSHMTVKLAAMKFIGALLQDYFNDLCIYLRKKDVIFLKNCLEALRHDSDSRTRRFYLNYWNDAVELSYYVQD
ncbi:maestro heat-like repeat family member 5 isoform X1 [Mus caroli]|uniref:Maestro heat-like repeat family member 5 isoform X1 n=1 Tax=Mus caroli TaxID=10089 RepID=A0A6P5R7I9_MUSCR|nr:maestro heat-like repeat family member 5 isoform X1 [Mus caroli]XP_021039717.1 maestro heat-like repeat family member 5 isoform X1 [Mus caroli]XP_021039718.1 maestro heat-like repeat family member 5 isoform X1 [Mus caroli]XP_021039719.1 maestro heat-like repeat family member 5 isoform X1 [Mus caroli]